jgi:hypothetical protein
MIKEITANARISFKQPTKQGDVFYTFEYGETRSGKYDTQELYEAEKAKLWEQVNNEVGKQVIETQKLYQG